MSAFIVESRDTKKVSVRQSFVNSVGSKTYSTLAAARKAANLACTCFCANAIFS